MKLAQIFSCFTFYDVTTPIFYTVDNQLITFALALLQNLTTDLVSRLYVYKYVIANDSPTWRHQV